MAQTLFGSGGRRGLKDDSGALNGNAFFNEISVDISEEEVVVEDHLGEVIGVSLGNQTAELRIDMVTKTSATTAQTVGDALGTIANADIYGTDTSVTVFLVTNANLRRVNKQWERGSVTARGYATQTDSTGTEESGA